MAKYRFLSLLSLALFIAWSDAVELQEVKPWELYPLETRDLQRREMINFDLRSTETFLWGADDGSGLVLGNLTVMMPGNAENILSMERFRGMLKSVKCEPTKLTLTFADDQTFEYAKRVWDWVNGADNHTFVMVASKGDCGDNNFRVPYKVYSLSYDEPGNVATLNASVGTWKDLAHTYEMRAGSIGALSPAVAQRDFSRSTSLGLGANFQFKGKIKIGSVFGEVQCNPCNTAGKLDFEFIIRQKLYVPVGAKFRAIPQGVQLRAAVSVIGGTGFGSKTERKSEDLIQIFKYPLPGGISIPGGVLSLGPQLVAELGWEFIAAEVSILVKTGATATIPDNSILEADLLNPSQNKFSGWVPQVKFDPFQFQARASAKFQVFVVPSVRIEAEVIGKGVETGISLKAPYIEVRADAIDAPAGGACKPGDGKEFALRLVPSWGFDVKFRAGIVNGEKFDKSLAYGSFGFSFINPDDLCWGFDDPTAKPSNSVPALPVSSKPAAANHSPGPVVNTCTVKGKPGTCIDKTACTNGGKVATPGYCLNDPNNVQCCTDSAPPGGNSCSVKGKAGTCMDKDACTNGGKVATPGYCLNDPDNVQCCTAGDTCTVKIGQSGTCMDKNACMNGGKVATAGFCPGTPNNIQCCTAYPGYSSCTVNSKTGTCLPTSFCQHSGGVSTPGHCLNDPDDVQCCIGTAIPKPGGGKNIPTRRFERFERFEHLGNLYGV